MDHVRIDMLCVYVCLSLKIYIYVDIRSIPVVTVVGVYVCLHF